MTPVIEPIDPVSMPCDGAVNGSMRRWLRLEGLAAFFSAVLLYARGGHSWGLFVILVLTPDLGFAGYLFGPRIGAIIYNLFHSYIVPAALGCGLWLAGCSIAIPLIWVAHIGFDRLLGYGLKYPTDFGDTHLGKLGKRAAETGNR
jgi:Domain of unknown function (DUF4260)